MQILLLAGLILIFSCNRVVIEDRGNKKGAAEHVKEVRVRNPIGKRVSATPKLSLQYT